jgi:hypothetical protein
LKFALRFVAFALVITGAIWSARFIDAVGKRDWSLAWLVFTFVVGCFWIAAILVRGSTRPLK